MLRCAVLCRALPDVLPVPDRALKCLLLTSSAPCIFIESPATCDEVNSQAKQLGVVAELQQESKIGHGCNGLKPDMSTVQIHAADKPLERARKQTQCTLADTAYHSMLALASAQIFQKETQHSGSLPEEPDAERTSACT